MRLSAHHSPEQPCARRNQQNDSHEDREQAPSRRFPNRCRTFPTLLRGASVVFRSGRRSGRYGLFSRIFSLDDVLPSYLPHDMSGRILFYADFVDAYLRSVRNAYLCIGLRGVFPQSLRRKNDLFLAPEAFPFYGASCGAHPGKGNDGSGRDTSFFHSSLGFFTASRAGQDVLAQKDRWSRCRANWTSSSMLYSLRDSSFINARLSFRSSCILSICS